MLQEIEYECPTQFTIGLDNDYNSYEITITFNPQLYSQASAWNSAYDQNLDEGVSKLLRKWLSVYDTQLLTYVIEYTKMRMPHIHACVQTEGIIPVTERFNITKAIQRTFGRCTFKPVISMENYEAYMEKDLQKNYDKSNIRHYFQFN